MTKLDAKDVAIFHASLDRVSADPTFLDSFYQRFMGISEEVAAVFHDRDMDRIKRKLRLTLNIITMVVDEEPGVDWYLSFLSDVHARLDIPPSFFDLWRLALIETVAQSDPAFDEAVRSAWNAVLAPSIKAMQLPRPPPAEKV